MAGGKLWSHRGERSHRGAEGKAERFPHRGSVPTSTHQPERPVCSPAGAGGGGELRLGLWRSDPRERTGVSCVNTAWRQLVSHSYPGGSPGKSLELPKRQETIVSGCARRGDSEHCLNELQRWARAAAISVDPRDGHETLRLLLQPPRSLCASTGHYSHLPSREPVQPATARVLWSRNNFPGRTHVVPRLLQHYAGLCHPRLAPHSIPLPPPGLREPEPPNQLLL